MSTVIIKTKEEETQRLHLTGCPRSIIEDLKKCALEKGIPLHEIAIEAWKQYLSKHKDLIEKEIVITT